MISPLLHGNEQTELGTSTIGFGGSVVSNNPSLEVVIVVSYETSLEDVVDSNRTSLSCIFSLLYHLPTI